MKHSKDSSLLNRAALGGAAAATALVLSPDVRAQSALAEPTPPSQFIGEYIAATQPRLGEDEPRSFSYDRNRYRRFDVGDDTELGLGRMVRRGIERITRADFPNRWEWRVTDQDEYGDGIPGTGARLRIAIPLNPVERDRD
ncbi:hypothetical protein K2X83_00665 [Patescibacteria group bacterium]|nr:hypothetical protein [Patescibacteria group bacterium]